VVSAAERAGAAPALPTLPVVVARLIALYGSDEYTADQVVRVLETDPSVSGRILRLANSAYYGFESRVDSLQRAAVLLGGAVVQAVALGATLLRPWTGSALPAEVEDIWVRAYLCGLGCRFLSLRLPSSPARSGPEALFLAGLLRDVGKLLFLAEDPSGYTEILKRAQTGNDLRVRERERFGLDHAEAGGELLEAWRLPLRTTSLVRHHHRGKLRAELQADWEVVNAASHATRGEDSTAAADGVPAQLLADLKTYLEGVSSEAQTFFRSVS
jgi:HD-like signal output (HDOD) protein